MFCFIVNYYGVRGSGVKISMCKQNGERGGKMTKIRRVRNRVFGANSYGGYHPGNHIPAASINDYLGGVRRH